MTVEGTITLDPRLQRAVDRVVLDVEAADAHVQNALESVIIARSTVVDHLSSPNDLYARVEILQDLDTAAHSLRKALL